MTYDSAINAGAESAQTSGAFLSRQTLERELNESQLEAVLHDDGPLLILAGAGSGKTRVITHRIARLVDEGLNPYKLIALTFTNKAAAEMKERTASLLGRARMDIWISTFHSACLRILRRHADRLGYPKDFTVYDAQDQTRLIKACLKELGIEEKSLPARQVASFISRFKNKLKDSREAEKEINPRRDMNYIRCFRLYEKKLNEARCMDFDDLLGKTVTLLRSEEDIRGHYQNRFEYVLVDEFQDTNPAQYGLIRLILGERRNICVVGDDDQSIYQWRGADISNILNFEKDFPETKVVLLEKNYRSTKNILTGASAIVSLNPNRKEKQLWTDNSAGENIHLYTATDEMDEARYVVENLLRLKKMENHSLNDVAVFYRTNSQSRAMEDALRREGVPYKIYGGLKFYDRREVKDILAYFRAALNPFDTVSFKRIINTPPRGLGAVTLAKLDLAAMTEGVHLSATLDNLDSIVGLKPAAKKKLESFREVFSKIRALSGSLNVADAINEALGATGYMDWLAEDKNSESISRMENLTELVNAAEEFQEREGESSIMAFLDQSALQSDADNVDENEAAVKLMTVHISKGLEFPVVFVTGLEDNLFPHARSKDDPKQMQEERRLMYVAMTRAKERLFLTHAETRRIFGVAQVNRPSVFLADLPSKILHMETSNKVTFRRPDFTSKTYKPKAAPATHERKQYDNVPLVDGMRPGMKVRHATFQVGVIRAIEGQGEKSKITIYFPRFGEKKLMKKFAKLTIV